MLRTIFVVVLLLLTIGCSQSLYMQGRRLADEGEYDRAIKAFYDDIKLNPASAETWRELGVAFYKKGDLDKAEEALKQANNIAPDARTNLYIGLVYEKQENFNRAIEAYRTSLSYNPGGNTRQMIEQHLGGLIALKVEREVTTAIQNEEKIDVASIPDNTLAVVDFNDEHLPPEMAPISKGLAEFTALDLAKIQSLKVVDRLKIDLIQKELQLGSSAYADPKFAPRIGKLLGSNNIVTGTVVGIGDDMIRLDGAVVNTRDSSSNLTDPTEGKLNNFFKIQKDFVFNIINKMGITLTQEERDAIEEVPTESYLAFMAYCRGLDYRSRGMMQEASRNFQQAAGADKNFGDAQKQLQQMVFAPAMSPGGHSFQQFETSVTAATDQLQTTTGIDQFQAMTLLNSGFISDPAIFERFGNTPIIPPQTGVTVNLRIIGDLDGIR